MSKKAKAHLSQDPRFREIVANTKLKRSASDGDVYAALLRTIVFQQLSGKAANTIHVRFLKLFQNGYPHADELLCLSQTELTNVGLSRQKSGYVQNVAKYWTDHQLFQTEWKALPDDEIVERLTAIKGVGLWSSQMILMFTLNRPDVFPVNDLGIRNAIIKRYRLRSRGKTLEKRLIQIAEPWRPYRTLACRYLWLWIDES